MPSVRTATYTIAQFLTNSTVTLFTPHAQGDATPSRSFSLPENDLTAIAVDSRLNDFVLSIRQPNAPIFVAPAGSSGYLASPLILSDPKVAQYASLRLDRSSAAIDQGGIAVRSCRRQ